MHPPDFPLFFFFRYIFHYISSGDLCAICLTDFNFDKTLAFAFLMYIQRRFQERYGTTINPNNPQYKDFSVTLKDIMVCLSLPTVDFTRTQTDYSLQSPEQIEKAKMEMRGIRIPYEQNIGFYFIIASLIPLSRLPPEYK